MNVMKLSFVALLCARGSSPLVLRCFLFFFLDYLYDKDPITDIFLSVPSDLGQLNCASFVAGIVNGILDGAEFHSEVSAHFNKDKTKTVYVIKFEKKVMARERYLGKD